MLVFDEKFRVSVPARISSSALDEIALLVVRETGNHFQGWDGRDLALVAGDEYNRPRNGGKFVTRLKHYLWENYSDLRTQIRAIHWEEIGTIAERNSRPVDTLADFTEKFLWKAGEFGDSGSCWWDFRAKDRTVLAELGGFAFRLYNEQTKRGWGRIWVLPTKEGQYATFNGYCGDNETRTSNPTLLLTRTLAEYWGKEFKKINIVQNHSVCDGRGMYLNPSRYIIGNKAEIKEIMTISTLSCQKEK